jgi:small subunit ribosomal protein S4
MKTQPKYKVCRRLGDGVHAKCQTPKYQLAKSRRNGGKKIFRRRPRTEFGTQLIEKQKVRFSYNISEKQLSKYVKNASKGSGDQPGRLLYSYLERRVDNIIYRVGLATSRQQARQIVTHGHILVNGRKLDVPSYQVSKGDEITLKAKSLTGVLFNDAKARVKATQEPEWLSVDEKNMKVVVKDLPVLDPANEPDMDYSTVIEFYNRV